jgi:XTP/dITP diphosphohydrolase
VKEKVVMKQKKDFQEMFPKRSVAYFVTSNVHKFFEASNLLSEYNIATAKLNVEAVEIQDNKLENIAKYSVLDALKKCKFPIFVEDSGIFIKALNGFPGPYSKYVYQTIGTKGIIKLMNGIKNRQAFFMSVVAFGNPDNQTICFVGRTNGKISFNERGTYGFGYDPIFKPSTGETRTFAEMKIVEKNEYSHRAKALRKFAEWYTL